MPGIFTAVKTWFGKPFDENGSVIDWFLFLGLVIILVMAWKYILNQITKEI